LRLVWRFGTVLLQNCSLCSLTFEPEPKFDFSVF
jgi:hypothetical protein